jgi:hypothetical protein
MHVLQFHRSCLEARAADSDTWPACTDKLAESKALEQPANELIDISGRRSPAGVLHLHLSLTIKRLSTFPPAHTLMCRKVGSVRRRPQTAPPLFMMCSFLMWSTSGTCFKSLWKSHVGVILSCPKACGSFNEACADMATLLVLQAIPGQRQPQRALVHLRPAWPPCQLTPHPHG